MDKQTKKALIAHLLPHITEHKKELMDQVIQNRTRYVTVLLEDIFQQHNASAIVRSVECFGIQDLHVIQDKFNFSVAAGVAMGSSKWISMYRHATTQQAYATLKSQGYRIVATTPGATACNLEDLSLYSKCALVFGTENVGLSEWALQNADEFVKIPMFGFTQSFNVSVSAALCFYNITQRLRSSAIPWHLSEDEYLDIYLTWLRRSIRGSAEYKRMFLAKAG